MFRLIEPSSGQIQNIVLVHSVSAHICALTECTNEPKYVAEFLMLFTNICCIY